MDPTSSLPFLRETFLFLAVVGILIPLLQRLRVNQVIGFLAAGVLLGPYGTGSLVHAQPWLAAVTFPSEHGVRALADLGVIFLMFLIGLELSLQRVWELRRFVFGAGTAQVLTSAVVIGGLAYAFGNSPAVSAVLGLVLSLSSTAVVMQVLAHARSLGTPMGQAAFSVLMLQDLAVVPVLIAVDLLSTGARGGVVERLALTTMLSLLVVGTILVLGRPVIRALFRTLARHHQPEVFTALSVLVVLGIGALTAAAGLSMALGAFLAGLLLAETEYRHEVEVTIEPFKGLLMGLFFVGVGMGIDPREVLRDPGWVAASVLGLLVIKSVLAAGVLRATGLSWGNAVEAGMLLGQGGEFAFIVIGAAVAGGILAAPIGQFMLLVVSLSLLVTPLWARAGYRLGRRIEGHGALPASLPRETLVTESAHVVIVGFGRVGRMLAEVFDQQGIPYVAVEQDVDKVSRLRAQGCRVYFGNASSPELLRKLRLEHAACLVVTMDSPAAARRAVHAARRLAPGLRIHARSHDEAHARELYEAGATVVVPELLEAGLLLSQHALLSAGVSEAEAGDIVAAQRERRMAAR